MTFPTDPNAPGGEDRSDALRKAAAAHNQRNAQARVMKRSFEQLVQGGDIQLPSNGSTTDQCTTIVHHSGAGTTLVLAPTDALELERQAKGL